MNGQNRPAIRQVVTVMDCADAGALASFYSRFLDWAWTHPAANGWAAITSPQGAVIAFQEVEGYTPPVWPWQAGAQGQRVHFDYYLDDLEEGVQYALACGAVEALSQFFTTSRTMLDPAGHSFCIDTEEAEPQA